MFCESLISERKTVYTYSFFEVTDIRKNFKIDSSEFDGLLHEIISKQPFINKEIIYTNEKCEIHCSSVSDYITFFNIIEIEKNMCEVCKK